jgi:arabinogalactan endo-1,4-beta-galactosidase
MKYWTEFFLSTASLIFAACSCNNRIDDGFPNNPINEKEESSTLPDFFFGADLSYVNEMDDCGAIYRNSKNQLSDPYEVFKNEGANLARFRLWHTPTWTNYSNLTDVKKAIRRAKDSGMTVLLDFHYSDTWADPGNQQIPAAWLAQVDNTPALGQLLYQYTYDVIMELHNEGLTPEIVQVGNEIRIMILQAGKSVWEIDWTRNSSLLNKAIQAVRDVSAEIENTIEIMVHVDQPEYGLWWFEEATSAGVTDYDWIGISYYPKWSEYTLDNVAEPLSTLVSTYNKKLMVVETAYPFTMDYADSKGNIMGQEALVNDYPATQQGQLDFLTTLTAKVKEAGGMGVVYWEPAWVSTSCKSAWENVALFDFDGKPTLGMQFFNQSFSN